MGRIVEIAGEKYYCGLDAIAARLGYKSRQTVRAKILNEGLLAIWGLVPGLRFRRWFTTDALLNQWLIGRAAQSRERVKRQRIATQEERRYTRRHAAKERQLDTRVAVGPNGAKPANET